ncbi:MAG TPA: hypothetical protein VHE23_03045 [Candidatus Acidoferrales bacterium]|nr:hypothetical protein [Candidatus Acidoferrales bacterium]
MKRPRESRSLTHLEKMRESGGTGIFRSGIKPGNGGGEPGVSFLLHLDTFRTPDCRSSVFPGVFWLVGESDEKTKTRYYYFFCIAVRRDQC